MESITLNLPEGEMARLKALADKQGVSPEELLKKLIEQKLRFEEAVGEVLMKNAELYRRLA